VTALRAQVLRLAYDDAFGMLTRPALLDRAERLPDGEYFVLALDLDGVHELNSQVGYEEVNRRVRDSFIPVFRHTDLVGRWYSGDEILILLPYDSETAIGLVKRLRREAAANSLSFTHALGTWPHPREALEDVVARLLRWVAMRKEAQKQG
jgi:GGDEF domain-containing protein